MPIEKSKYVQDFENRNVILRYGEKLGKFEVDAFNWVKNGCVKGWNKVFNSKKKTVNNIFNRALQIVLFVSLPAAIGLSFLATQVWNVSSSIPALISAIRA